MMHLTMKRENKPLNRIKILLDITHPKKKEDSFGYPFKRSLS